MAFAYTTGNEMTKQSVGGVDTVFAYDDCGRMVSRHVAGVCRGLAIWTWPRANSSKEWPRPAPLDAVLPAGASKDLRLRVASRPERRLAILLRRLGFILPNRPKPN